MTLRDEYVMLLGRILFYIDVMMEDLEPEDYEKHQKWIEAIYAEISKTLKRQY